MLAVLASYPKSGNTWLRRFVACYSNSKLIPLNEMYKYIPSDCSYVMWESILQKDYSIGNEGYVALRPSFYQALHEQVEGKAFFLKTHSLHAGVNGSDLFDDRYVDKYIHIVRNPLDVLSSFAHHMSKTISQTWEDMKTENFVLFGGGKDDALFQEVPSSWLLHTQSWLNLSQQNVSQCITVRYEDMKIKPITTFSRIIQHLGLIYDENLLLNALNWSSFNAMKQEEAAVGGFEEAPSLTHNFFRKGQIGSGSEEVPQHIQDEMFALWEPLIRQLGYEGLFGK